jgi:outer membrane protein assembly factor BamB
MPPDPTLVGYWPFEGDLVDASGNGHDGTPTNIGYAPGFAGQGLALGATSFVLVPSLDAGVFGTGDFTYSVCVNVIANLGPFDIPFYMGGSNGNLRGADLELGTGAWAFSIKDGAGDADQYVIVGDDTLTGTGFHCLAAKVERGNQLMSVYRDGAFVASQDTSTLGPLLPGGETLRFGGEDTNNYLFDGVVDEVRIYTRALSDAEIAALHTP